MDIKKILRYGFVFMALIGAFMLAVAGPAAGIGFFEAKRQDPVKGTPLFNGIAKGNCIPTGAKQYLTLFNDAAQKAGIDVNLAIAIAQQESHFDPKVTSPTGNAGLMQISVDKAGGKDPYDPKVNIDAGTNYIAQQLKTFNGKGRNRTEKLGQYVKSDLDLALAAYNAGPGAIHGVIPNFTETINYVKIVEGNYQRILSCLERQGTSTDTSGNAGKITAAAKAAEGTFPVGQGKYCGWQTWGVYSLAGVADTPISQPDSWYSSKFRVSRSAIATTQLQPGQMLRIGAANGTKNEDHMIILDKQFQATYKGQQITVWSFWSGDASNPLTHTSDNPADWIWNGKSLITPYNPDRGFDGPPLDIWNP